MDTNLLFAGYSDDTFGLINHTEDDHDNCANGSTIIFRVQLNDESLLVCGKYAPEGKAASWHVGVANDEVGGEELRLPPWPISIRPASASETPYSPVLQVVVPGEPVIICLNRK